jgi:hypothetical protein
MPKFTIITNTSTVLHLKMETGSMTRIFAELLTGNPDANEVKCLQTASQELKDRLTLFDVLKERSYKIKHFFNHIPTGQHFYFLPGHIDEQLQIFLYARQLVHLDGITFNDAAMEKFYSYLFPHYEARTYQGNVRFKVGVYEKDKRVCRFCGKTSHETTFKEKSHAISESLGCKNLICLEECDACNHRFNETIEQDIGNYFRLNLILKGVKGKNGMPTLKGSEVSITNDTSSRETLGRDTLVFRVKEMPDTRDPQVMVKYLSRILSFPSAKFVPQNIYKCFCKYVLSLIDAKYLPFFKGTVDWINEPLAVHRLPPVWHYDVSMGEVPSIVILIRKHNQKKIPYCWAIMNVAGSQYMFIVPFCSQDKYKFVWKNSQDYFLQGIRNMMPNVQLNPIPMDGITSVEMKIDSKIEIPPECVEGRDYHIIEPGEKL